MRIPKVATLRTPGTFLRHLEAIGVELPFDSKVDPGGPLSRPVEAGGLRIANRFCALPMEGWDGERDGRPSDLVRRRWSRIGHSGCGLVWGEATAVRADGRANPRQLVLTEASADGFASLRSLLGEDQIGGIQLTHSGRYSRPDGEAVPRIAYRHPVLDERVGATDASVVSDDELDELVERFVEAAVLARQAGFDFVDVKHCHGYLLHELLSAYDRPGRYGGDLEGRTRFLRSVAHGVRSRAPGLEIAVRLSVFDFVPFEKGADGTGVAASGASPRYAFGSDEAGLAVDLSEAHEVLDVVSSLGITLVCTSAGSPYSTPHIQRPAYFPPSDGYTPPEDPLVGVARQVAATADVAHRHPGLVVVGSGYSYLQEWLPHVGQAVVRTGGASLVGLGRMLLPYPGLAADVLAGRPLDRRTVCRTFSDCTTAPRNGLVSGCYPLDPFYKGRPERGRLAEAKAGTRLLP